MSDPKKTLVAYLQRGRDGLLWKLDGLSEYDARRPLTPTGTNLLGIVQHLAWVEAGYLGATFGRPFPEAAPWDFEDDTIDPNSDFVLDPSVPQADLIALYGRVQAWGAETIDSLRLDAPGRVPWWGDHGAVTLHQILTHLVAEVFQHAGHADILREQLDGRIGRSIESTNVPGDGYDWSAQVARVQAAADAYR